MMDSIRSRFLIGAVLTLSVAAGCSSGPAVPLELTTMAPSDQRSKIARLYSHEAAMLREKAELLKGRAELYAGLFGAGSEWVTGTRLLAEFYEVAAKERERLAGIRSNLTDE